jgi:hypothetical protein
MASTTSLSSLLAKVHILLENLPPQVTECRAMRVSANKDTAAVSRTVQKWRKPTNPISQGKLGSFVKPKSRCEAEPEAESFSMDPGSLAVDVLGKLNAFSIGTPHADTGVRDTRAHSEWKSLRGVDPHLSLATDCPRYVRARRKWVRESQRRLMG